LLYIKKIPKIMLVVSEWFEELGVIKLMMGLVGSSNTRQ
jgi:hypothetical protein